MAPALFDMLENAGDDIGIRDLANHAKFPDSATLASDEGRNRLILDDVVRALEEG